MVLIKLVGVTTACIKHCSFTAVLIWNFKVDWEAADVKTHKDTLSPPQADLQPSALLCKNPDTATLAACVLPRMRTLYSCLRASLNAG